MKKKYIILTIFLFIISLGILNNKSLASFYIQNFEINSEVQNNGDMIVEENITYYSDENKNGVTREINTKNSNNFNNSADGLNLISVKVDGNVAKKVNFGTIGDEGVYEYTSSGNTYNLKVYVPFRGVQKRTITYKYLLKNVGVRYNDTSEIYWNFIGDEWDTKISNLTINIKLPDEVANGTIYVYGHGSDNGTFTKNRNNIKLYAKDLKANQALDARILFPTNALLKTTKIVNKSVLNKYINQEEGLTNKREEPEIIFNLNAKNIAYILSIIVIIIWIIIYFIYDKEIKVKKQYYYREIPCDLEPEVLQRIYYGKNQKNSFWIAFLNLVKLGVYKIEETTNEVGKKVKVITYLGKENKELKDYQNSLINTINGFFDVGKNSIEIEKLNAKMKRSTGSGYKRFVDKLEEQIESYFGDNTKVSKKPFYISIIIMVIVIAIIGLTAIRVQPDMAITIGMFLIFTTFIYSAIFSKVSFNLYAILLVLIHFFAFESGIIGMLSIARINVLYIPYIIAFVFLQYTQRIRRLSKEEREIREQIKGLRRYLRDYSKISERDLESIIIWEDYLVIAIALKLNKKTINYLYDYCKDNLNNNFGNSLNSFETYYYMNIICRSAFNNYTRRYISSNTSRYSGGSSFSGSSGGFSGGSSSGGRRTAEVEEEAPFKRRWRKVLFPFSIFYIVGKFS